MEEKKDKVIIGSAQIHRKSVVEKFVGAFVAKSFKEVMNDVTANTIVPSTKRLIADAINYAVSSALFGSGTPYKSGSIFSNNSSSGWWNTSKLTTGSSINYWNNPTQANNVNPLLTSPNYPNWNDIRVDSVEDAKKVLEAMSACIDRYGRVTVNDLFDFVDLPGLSTYNNYGWFNMKNASFAPSPDGRYCFVLPNPSPLNNAK